MSLAEHIQPDGAWPRTPAPKPTSTVKPLFGAQADAGDVAGSFRQPSWSANLSSRAQMAAERSAAARAQRDGSQTAQEKEPPEDVRNRAPR